MHRRPAVLWLIACTIFSAHSIAVPASKAVDITEFIILHNNDMHARFEQTSINSGKCLPSEADSNKCYGGFARTAHEIRRYRENAKNGGIAVMYLNAGDTYTGTPWFTIFKDNITAAFLNKLSPDAISLGNHEFDDGVEGLVPFLNQVNFPVLAANLDLKRTPTLAAAKNLAKSTIINVRGVKVGVIGYLTPDTKTLVAPNDVDYYPEIESINKEAEKLKESDVKIIIALGHSGYQKDQAIAKGCTEVDIVIGGHTNTFLYNGKQPNLEHIDGPYPTVVTQTNGKKVPVVQAYAYSKYLGKLHVQFDKDGNLIKFDGQPILLNSSIDRESDVLKLLDVYRPKITELETTVIGHTKVYLDGRAETCRKQECNLGNLIADSMVYARSKEYSADQYWSDAAIAFIQGGGIRNSIEKRPDGSITESDILSVLPFGNDIYVSQVSAKVIFRALERSISLRNKDSNGGFLQMAGVKVVYDINRKDGERVVSVMVMCAECKMPIYEELLIEDTKKMYNVIVPEFLLNGGDGHYFNSSVTQRLQKIDTETLSQYIRDRQIVYPGLEDKITIMAADSNSRCVRITSSLLTIVIAYAFRKFFN